jgi:hypothetical protein
MLVFWFLAPFALTGGTGVSQEHTASIFKAEDVKMEAVCSFEIVVYLQVHVALRTGRPTWTFLAPREPNFLEIFFVKF